jgi:hypothetical protein
MHCMSKLSGKQLKPGRTQDERSIGIEKKNLFYPIAFLRRRHMITAPLEARFERPGALIEPYVIEYSFKRCKNDVPEMWMQAL